jgi:hemerythrin
MALLDWNDKYSVKVSSIDAQHKKLFDMVNELHDAMKSGTGSTHVPAILNLLVAYTREHFANEERLMVQAKYANFALHKAEHDALTSEVVKMARDLEYGRITLSVQLLEFLKNWLQNHILSSDRKYSGTLHAAGVR